MKTSITNITTFKYDAREIIGMIAKDLKVPTKALSFTINTDGSYNITCNNDQLPLPETVDPYDQYRDSDNRLPPGMW